MQHLIPQPTTLTDDELQTVLSRIILHKETCASRICRLLAAKHSATTVEVNQQCSVGNISDCVSVSINPRIEDLGLYVACVTPPKPILNKFRQPSGQHLWSFYRDTAANDAVYDPAEMLANHMTAELHHLQIELPNLELPDDNWRKALQKLDGVV